MAKELVEKAKFYNLLCQHLGNQSDIVDQIEKNLRDFDDYNDETFDRQQFKEKGAYFKSWESYAEHNHYFGDKKIHFYYEERSTFKMDEIDEKFNYDYKNHKRLPLLFLWTVVEKDDYYGRHQSVILMDESFEEENEIIEFLTERNSFTNQLDIIF